MVVMRGIVSATLLAVSAAGAAAPCGADLRGAQVVESANYTLVYRSAPAKIAVGRHFALDIAACAKGAAAAPASLSVDAFMPAHGHGMNYKPAVTKAAPANRFRAEGLMFHMPGRWDFYFDVQSAGKNERLTHSILLE
jgi:hypothetical protein